MIRVQFKSVEGFQEERPLELDFVSSAGNVYMRRNITEVPNVDQDGEETEGTHWKYEECILTVEEYQEYPAEIENPMLSTIMQTLTSIQLQIDEIS